MVYARKRSFGSGLFSMGRIGSEAFNRYKRKRTTGISKLSLVQRNKSARRNKHRTAYSRTRTRTKRENVKVETSGHSTRINQYLKIVVNETGPKKGTPEWDYRQNYSLVANSTAGLQGVSSILGVMTKSQVCNSTGINYSTEENNEALVTLDPNLTNTGGGAWGSSVIPANKRFWVKNIDIKFDIVNGTGHSGTYDLYFMMCKKDSINAPEAQWDEESQDAAFGGSGIGYPGAGTSGGQTLGWITNNYPHNSPYECKTLKKYWKVLKKQEITLSGGEAQSVHAHIVYNKKVSYGKNLDSDAYVPNQTIMVMGILRGSAMVDNTSVVHKASLASMKFYLTASVKYTLAAIKNSNVLPAGPLGVQQIPTQAIGLNETFIDTADKIANLATFL